MFNMAIDVKQVTVTMPGFLISFYTSLVHFSFMTAWLPVLQARKFGVRAAMPGFIARKLCPKLTFVPVDFKKYTHYSNLTRQG